MILDILDGLPDYMLPTLKSSITPGMHRLDFRRILLDYEKASRWNDCGAREDRIISRIVGTATLTKVLGLQRLPILTRPRGGTNGLNHLSLVFVEVWTGTSTAPRGPLGPTTTRLISRSLTRFPVFTLRWPNKSEIKESVMQTSIRKKPE